MSDSSMELGVNFPAAADGRRGSTGTAKQVLASAVRTLDPLLGQRIEGAADWRQTYPQYFVDLTRVEARSYAAALDVARAGLESAHRHFAHVTPQGDRPLAAATTVGETPFSTAEVAGGARPQEQLTVPYQGELLHGSSLLRQLDDWASRGITEPSFAEAVGEVVRNPDWLDLSDRAFALIGAGAAMGPFDQLMAWGATVAAVDLPRPAVWQRLAATAQSSAGRLLVPVRRRSNERTGNAGADLLTEVALVERWLRGVEGPLTLGNYGYADGALFVRLSMAFDLLVDRLADHRDDLSMGYLATPSDAFLVPADAVAEADRRLARRTPGVLAARAAHLVSAGRWFRPNYDGLLSTESGEYGLVDAFIHEQGQNYALAKRLQRWRTVVARDTGMLTSVHVAPPTRTESVHKNPVMAQRQRLSYRLGLEPFDAATSRALSAAILVHDLRNPKSPANPDVPLQHPHEAFMFAANPGGRWRAPLEPRSSIPALRLLDRLHLAGSR